MKKLVPDQNFQRTKISVTDSFPADRVPGITVEHNQYVPDTPWSQDQDDSERSFSASLPGQFQRGQAGTVYREAECCIPGSLPSPTVLSPSSEGPTRSPSQGRSELDTSLQLAWASREEIQWWQEHLTLWNDRALLSHRKQLVIQSDAFMTAWGAVCKGFQTGGPWSQAEQMLHINCLELTAATLAVQAFAKDRSGISILLQLDNHTAVAYINHLGGTVSLQLVQLSKTLWLWALQRDIILSAQHIPGMTN